MNKWIAMGRPTKDPEVRYTKDNKAIATINLAVDRRFKREGHPAADFFKCTGFGKTAEFIEKYIRKGTKVVVEGTVQNDNYEKDGVKHYQDKVIIQSVEFAESKKAADGNTQPTPPPSDDDFMTIPEIGPNEKVPF
jgi:single-strand DNA-binding protein